MFGKHTRTVINPSTGQPELVKATCAEINATFGSHVNQTFKPVDGKSAPAYDVVSCAHVDAERAQLKADKSDLEGQVASLEIETNELTAELDNCLRLMSGAIQIIFGMGPALQSLLSVNLSAPALTSDRSSVKVEGVNYTVIIDVFKESITVVSAATEGETFERTFKISNGRLDEDQRTLLLGYVTRINQVALGQKDPVQREIDLVSAA